jgi:hypothetical protein
MTPAEHPDLRDAQDALSHLMVEREERADGRYVLYFSWPEESAADDEAEAIEPDV